MEGFMSYEPSERERKKALREYLKRARIKKVPRVLGTDEHGYAALNFYWETRRCKLTDKQRAALHKRGYDDKQLRAFARYNATVNNSEERIKLFCAIADALIADEPDCGLEFELCRATPARQQAAV